MRGKRLGDEHVVVDRYEKVTDPAQQRLVGAGGQRGLPGPQAAVRRRQHQAGAVVPDRVDPRVLEQAHAGVQAGLAQATREPRRVDHRAGVPVPRPAQEGGGIELAAHRGRVELGHVVTETAGGFDLLVQIIELPGLSGDRQLAYRREAAVDAAGGHRLADLGQVLRAQFSSSGISAGKRDRPLPILCVRLAEQNPPLRPDAAPPAVLASRTKITSADGSRSSRASSAVHNPENPPPTTARSAAARLVSGARDRGARLTGPKRRGRAPASAATAWSKLAAVAAPFLRDHHASFLRASSGENGRNRGLRHTAMLRFPVVAVHRLPASESPMARATGGDEDRVSDSRARPSRARPSRAHARGHAARRHIWVRS